MKKTIKDVFVIAGHKIDFSAVGYSLKGLPRKLSSLLRGKTPDQIETTVYDSLKKKWNGIESGNDEFHCYREKDGGLCPCHVEAGRGIPFYPCVFILKCNLFMSAGKEIHLRIKIDKTGQTYNSNLYGVTYEYKVSELFVCDEGGNSLLGFSQMPFPMDLKSLFLSLSRACGKESLTKEDEGKVAKNVYESWIRHGMLTDSEQPLIKDTARHLTFETGLQTKDGRNVQVILWKDAATDHRYEFRVVMGMSSILDQNEADQFDSRPLPAKPTISLPVSREIRDAVNKKLVQKSIDADDEIPQDNPEGVRSRLVSTSAGETVDDVGASPIPSAKGNTTYLFGPNVGGAIVAAKNEQHQKKAVNMPTDTIQKNTDGAKAQSAAEAASDTGKGETEVELLTRFINAVKDCGFHYAEQDLIRFHTCVKCGFLTVLGGAPGAGKSSLVKLYASAILGRVDGKCRDGMLMVDVNSSWAEPSDVLGYWDLERHYRPSTGVVPFLRKAIRSEHLNIVCLEEMNLARVEHYFSDFMQLSEREIAERELKGVPLEPKNTNQEEARLPIGKSVRIVGTNNFDQTTQRFSARFFDRCNYIELQDSRKNEDFLFSRPNIDQGNFNCTVSWDTYESWIKISPKVKMEISDKGFVIKDENEKEIFGEGIVERFKKIWGALKKLNLKPSPRVESSLVEYVVNRPFIAEYETECKTDYDRQLRALDEFVAQRILPRYTPSYLIDDSDDRDALETALKDMTLSLNILNEKKSELDGKPHA